MLCARLICCRVPLTANYIWLNAEHHHVYQYHVSFNPTVDSKKFRFALLKDHSDDLGPRVFDGSILFLPKKLEKKVVFPLPLLLMVSASSSSLTSSCLPPLPTVSFLHSNCMYGLLSPFHWP